MDTTTNAVIYARFSSHSQQEQSIDGQLRYCREYAAQHGYAIVAEYCDRAMSGTNDNRPEFQRMIRDAAGVRAECTSAHHNAVGTNAYIVFVGGYIGIVCPREL